MKKIILNIAVIAFVIVGAVSCKENKNTEEVAEAAEATDMATDYNVDASKSIITWKGDKPTGSHHGTIQITSGTISASNEAIQAGNFTIDMNTIVDKDLEGEQKANLEAHLKGTAEGKEGDFFNVAQYPTSTFEMTSVSGTTGDVTVKGNLTIKDKTNPIEFPATVTLNDTGLVLKTSTFKIDRTKWDVNYGSKSIFDNLGDKFISDDIELMVELHATK